MLVRLWVEQEVDSGEEKSREVNRVVMGASISDELQPPWPPLYNCELN